MSASLQKKYHGLNCMVNMTHALPEHCSVTRPFQLDCVQRRVIEDVGMSSDGETDQQEILHNMSE